MSGVAAVQGEPLQNKSLSEQNSLRLLFCPVVTTEVPATRARSRLLPSVTVPIWRKRRRHFRREIDILRRIVPAYVHERFFVMLFCDEHVKRWHNEQSENRSDSHSADEHETDRISCRGAGSGHEGEWKMTGDRGHACHHDGTQTNACGLRDGSQFC